MSHWLFQEDPIRKRKVRFAVACENMEKTGVNEYHEKTCTECAEVGEAVSG